MDWLAKKRLGLAIKTLISVAKEQLDDQDKVTLMNFMADAFDPRKKKKRKK